MTSAGWDAQAATFDAEPDHGLSDAVVREAWRRLLREALPTPPARIADLGCGTGTLSLLLAEDGHTVDCVDFSPLMLARARVKTAGWPVELHVGDAADPALADGEFDAVVCRHVLWALPDPEAVLRRWSRLVGSDGQLLLIEGRWSTGAGISAERCAELVERIGRRPSVTALSDSVYWGKPIDDERYLLAA